VSVEDLDNLLKEEELGHGIRDLLKTIRKVRSEKKRGVLT
jgi:hypothetical protein